jgi:uncharacterized protein
MTVQRFRRETIVAAPRPDVFAFFSDPRNLARITPPSLGFEIVRMPDRALRAGDRIDYVIRLLGIPVRWRTVITVWEPDHRFVDEQERGPYRSWRHEHVLTDMGTRTLMVDQVDYRVPLGVIGAVAAGWWVRRNLKVIFDYRAGAIAQIFG